jgi:hypothetical protein
MHGIEAAQALVGVARDASSSMGLMISPPRLITSWIARNVKVTIFVQITQITSVEPAILQKVSPTFARSLAIWYPRQGSPRTQMGPSLTGGVA